MIPIDDRDVAEMKKYIIYTLETALKVSFPQNSCRIDHIEIRLDIRILHNISIEYKPRR